MRKTSSNSMSCYLGLQLLLLSLCLTQAAVAQDPSVIDSLLGEWEGKGRLFGADASFSMKWEWVLGRQFLRLTFQNKMPGADGTERVLRAQAFYKPTEEGKCTGTWFDSRGMVLPLDGSVDHETLTINWGTPETEQGRTVYRTLNNDRIEVKDFVLRGEEWHHFGEAIYKRR